MTTKEKLLELLESDRETDFSGEEIARSLCVSRAAVWKAVTALRQDGYAIDAVTNRGYRLPGNTDILSAQGIRKYLKPEYRTMELAELMEDVTKEDVMRIANSHACDMIYVLKGSGQAEEDEDAAD